MEKTVSWHLDQRPIQKFVERITDDLAESWAEYPRSTIRKFVELSARFVWIEDLLTLNEADYKKVRQMASFALWCD